jgi:hypothetical protein
VAPVDSEPLELRAERPALTALPVVVAVAVLMRQMSHMLAALVAGMPPTTPHPLRLEAVALVEPREPLEPWGPMRRLES